MSPLRTEAFHQRRNLEHLFSIGLICFESCNLLSDVLTAMKGLRRIHQCLPDRFRARHSGSLQAGQSSFGLFVQPEGYRSSHTKIVSQYVIPIPTPSAQACRIKEEEEPERKSHPQCVVPGDCCLASD